MNNHHWRYYCVSVLENHVGRKHIITVPQHTVHLYANYKIPESIGDCSHNNADRDNVQTWTKVLGHFSQAHILPSYVVPKPIIILQDILQQLWCSSFEYHRHMPLRHASVHTFVTSRMLYRKSSLAAMRIEIDKPQRQLLTNIDLITTYNHCCINTS